MCTHHHHLQRVVALHTDLDAPLFPLVPALRLDLDLALAHAAALGAAVCCVLLPGLLLLLLLAWWYVGKGIETGRGGLRSCVCPVPLYFPGPGCERVGG